MKNDERGMTMVETLVVVVVVALVAAATGLHGLNWIRSERQRGTVYELFIQMSQARGEAVGRNRSCRFVVDTAARTMSVIDLNDPAVGGDDTVISVLTLEPGVGFGLPDGSTAITLNALSATRFEAAFSPDGTLSSGVGSIGLQAGERFHRVSVYAGGGIAVERWDGSGWVDGT